MARQPLKSHRGRRTRPYPLERVNVAETVCLELQDHSVTRQSAVDLFGTRNSADPSSQAARLAEQFIRQNQQLLNRLDTRIERDYDGKELFLVLHSGSLVGAIPLYSPLTARADYGLLIQPRFPWPGIGPMMSEMGWRVAPTPLRLPLLRRSERRVPNWVTSVMILPRLKALLDRLDRRFEIVSESRSAPRGSVRWAQYATRSLPNAHYLDVPCTFPDLREDRELKGAILYAVEKQIQSLNSQRSQGCFVMQLIEEAEHILHRVQGVPPCVPSSMDFSRWQRRPMRTEYFTDGIQSIEWTKDDRALAGLSDLQGIPWSMPMDAFFEAWMETICSTIARCTGARLRVGRKHETTCGIRWEPPYQGSQKSLQPDIWLEWESTTLIVDAKYKRHWEEMQEHSWASVEHDLREQHRHDLLQVLAYANLARTPNVVACLAYPCSQNSWISLKERGRLIHRATLPVGTRSLELWLTAVPIAADVRTIATPLQNAICQMLRARETVPSPLAP